MFVQAYGAALLIILASVLLGQAICVAVGDGQSWWAAPAVGLASLIVLAGAAIKLPGRGVTAVVVLGLVLAAAAAFLWRRSVRPRRLGDLVVGAVSLLGASLPFIANARVGLQGVGLDNDTAKFLLFTEALRSPRMAALWSPGDGYPLGPHSVTAALATATGMPLDMAFTGLLLAIVAITALVAAGVLADQALWRRALIGLMCSLAYLAAAYYAEGSFKETIMAGLLLGFVVHCEQVRARWNGADAATRWRSMLPALLMVAGAFYTYSYVGLAWFVLTVALWVIAEVAVRPALLRGWMSRPRLTTAGPWLAGTAALALILVLPVAGQTISFFHSVGVSPASSQAIQASVFGNLIHALSPYEAFGIWSSPDFRTDPLNGFRAGELSAFALGVLVFGLLWSLRRRQLLMPAAVAACLLIWWRADRSQSPYVTAKGLVIAAPLIMALGLRGLLTRREGPLSNRALTLAAAAVFCSFAAYSSYQALRNEPVQAPEADHELVAFHRIIGDAGVLFLGDDDFAPWQLRDAAVTSLAPNSLSAGGASARVNKPYVAGQSVDFDSVDAQDLDHFRYVITSNTPYASQVPANFRLLTSARLYDLWRRIGPTLPRRILEPSGAPGAILNCRTPVGEQLRAQRGQASIMPTPVTLPGRGLWAGGSVALPIALPRGEWEISIQYTSSFAVDLSTQTRRWTMPAYLGRPGPFFGVGTVAGQGVASPVTLTFHAQRPSFLTGTGDILFAYVSLIAATRIPDTRQIVPLSQACGRYVDWYRLS
jgi:hypothetical protein